MSGISQKQLDDWQRDIDLNPKSFTSCLEEIRRLRAENKELRDSYERVDRARRELQKPFTSGRGFA